MTHDRSVLLLEVLRTARRASLRAHPTSLSREEATLASLVSLLSGLMILFGSIATVTAAYFAITRSGTSPALFALIPGVSLAAGFALVGFMIRRDIRWALVAFLFFVVGIGQATYDSYLRNDPGGLWAVVPSAIFATLSMAVLLHASAHPVTGAKA